MDRGTRAAGPDESAAVRRRELEIPPDRGHDLAVASYVSNGVDSQDLGVPVAEELLGLPPDGGLSPAAAAG
jgi:hypothetical protein